MNETAAASPALPGRGTEIGALLVFGSAFVWSFGGALARFLAVTDSWTVVFWRCLFASVFLLAFMLLRDGPRGTVALFRAMGFPGLLVSLAFATASTCFILAIAHTTVANVVLIQASVPLLAALIAWFVYKERVSLFTWGAIGTVIAGVAIMVSGSLTGHISPVGDALALLIAFVFSVTTVVTRRYTHVRMTPAAFVGCAIATVVALANAGPLAVSPADMGVLFLLGVANLGLGMVLFVSGARLIPAALAALLGTAETMMAPIWVAVIHGEIPNAHTLVGGLLVLAALIAYLTRQFRGQRAAA